MRFVDLSAPIEPTSADVPQDWTVEVALPPDYYYYMSPARFWASRVMCTARTLRPARGVDLVHAIKDCPHNQIALDAARRAGKPCVATAHGTYTIQPLLSERHALRARRVYSNLDHMISVSRYTRGRLLELLDAGAPKPAAIIGMPVGFVGAAESKLALEAYRAVPSLTVRGRKGGSAMAVAAVNALAREAE